MKQVMICAFVLSMLTACNFKESLKEAGDTIQDGAQNVAGAAKELPGDVSEASNKAEADVKN